MLVADACSSDRPLGESAVAGWYTLIHASGRQSDWRAFVEIVPTSLLDLNIALAQARSPGLVDLLSNLIAALSRPLLDPPANAPSRDVESGVPSHGDVSASDVDELSEGEEDPDVSPRRGKQRLRGPLDNEKARANPVAWMLEASNYAYHSQRVDLIGDRDRLHPKATMERWRFLKERYRNGGSQERQFVAFAHVSQRLAQPARVALPLRLDGKRSTQLDVPGGTVVWNCLAALSASADPALDALELRQRSFAIHRLLDADIADYLRLRLVEQPDASTLAELLGIDTTPDALKVWLGKYREFLRKGKHIHPAYDARWAGSLGDIYRYLGAGEALAFYGGPDFDALPIGMASYITLDAETLAPIEQDVFRFLGWRMPEDRIIPGPQGSPISITREEFRVGWSTCQERTRHARADLKAARTADEFVDAFNRLTRSRLVALITLSAHRGTRLSRLTWRGLYQCAQLILIFDKDVGEYQSDRGVPVHRRLDQVLAAWQDDLTLMRDKAEQLGLSMSTNGRRAVPGMAADDPVFFAVRLGRGPAAMVIERTALRFKWLSEEAEACFASPLNIGRHFLVSQLIARRVSAWHVRVLTGHCRIHAEAFSDGMHVPPAHAMAVLRDEIEKLLDSLDLAPIANLDPSKKHRHLINLSGSLPSAADPYLSPSASNVFRILPAPFDTFTPVALRAIEDLRRRACEITGMSPRAEFTAAQTLFALLDRVDQEAIFSDLATTVSLAGPVACAVWERPNSAQPIGMRLNDRSVIALAHIKNRSQPGNWRNSAEEVGRWARNAHPMLGWPTNDFDAYLSLLALALRFRRFHYAPDLLTAASPALPSATFSRRSVLRIAGIDRALTPTASALGKALRQGNPRPIKNKGIGPLYDVAEALRSVSRISYPLGGEVQRAKDWKEKLKQIDNKDDLRAAALKKLHDFEISLWEKLDKKEADETSTLAGHLGEILTALSLLSPRDDPSEFTEQDWRDWVEAAKQVLDEKGKNTKAVKNNQTRYFGLKRLVRIARKIGWSAPRGLFTDGSPRISFDGLRRSAASVAVLSSDHAGIRELLTDHFEDWPLLQWQAELAATLHEHHPLRSSEQTALVVRCLVHESQMLLIKPGDFSHLKSVHAYRLLDCAKQVVELFGRVDDGSIDLKSKYLFLDNSGWDWSDARLIDDALVSAAAQVTGEAAVRKHSFRGNAYCRLLWPEWEVIARALLAANRSPSALREMLERDRGRGFAVGTLAARSAGHGLPVVGLVYYAAAWALMHSAQSRALLADLAPDSRLIEGVLGSTGSIRNAKSIAKAAEKDFDIWGEVARRCVKQMQLPPLVTTEERAVIAPRNKAADSAAPPFLSCVRLVAHLLAGGKRDSLANTLGIAKPYALHLESMLPDADRRKAVTHRRRGDATLGQLAEDRAFMDSKLGRELLANLATHPLPALTGLLIDLAPYRRNPRDPTASPAQLLQRLHSHLKVLPSPLRLQVRFNYDKYGCPLTAEQQHSLGERLVVSDNPRIGRQPECQVLPAELPPPTSGNETGRTVTKHRQSELVGRLTVATRLYIEALEITHQTLNGRLQ
ncbi:hypothetical protein [Roseateles violae]|uniref:Tyr recombinase domain-containing protein n=1 Tax=Roseateles violae TaxID=3058042 RepID=A0ABT8DT44_9BURK|nr:hypothetical protein [Pelomonas sp. PFR6]MDN3921470.1 hypothetical protein [Pelomonas sp. PFR6]